MARSTSVSVPSTPGSPSPARRQVRDTRATQPESRSSRGVLDGDDDFEIEQRKVLGVDDRIDLAAAGDELPDLLDRPLCGRTSRSAGEGCSTELFLEPLDRERHMRAVRPSPGDRVHLVEDQRVDRAKDVACLRGQHQIERLGCRDQDVRRFLRDLAALLRRCVAGVNRDAHLRLGSPASGPGAGSARCREVERLERRGQQDACSSPGVALSLSSA